MAKAIYHPKASAEPVEIVRTIKVIEPELLVEEVS